MSRYIRALLLVGSLIAASHAEAAVVISEIAWMGSDTENGSNCEWIELYNPDSTAVNLSGWTVKIANAGGSTPKVLAVSELESGSSTILQPQGFYVFARNSGTCLDTEPGKSADWFGSFGTGISNTGSTLTLFDSAGISMDTVNAEAGWNDIGGLNVSGKAKLTPQRNGTDWVTATPTPRATNATVSEQMEATSITKSTSSSSSKKPSVPKLYIEAGEDRIVSTHAHTKYGALVYSDSGSIIREPKITWTYGEGSRDRSEAGYHAYAEPGEYVVVAHAQNGVLEAQDSLLVTVDTAQVRIAEVLERGIKLENFDDRMLDLSYWHLRAGGSDFEIPADTWILPGRTVLFPAEVTGLAYTEEAAALLYPSGRLMNEYAPATSTSAD